MKRFLHTYFTVNFGVTTYLISIMLLILSPVHALPTYAFEQRDVDRQTDASEKWSILRVYNQKTGRTVWSRRCDWTAGYPVWSQDHRSFAIEIGNLFGYPRYLGQFRLLYWRAGHKVRLVTHPELFADFDDLINMRWSPDGRRFAFLGGSTAFQSGGPYFGTLCCVDAVTGCFFFGPSEVGYYRWVDAQRMRYLATRLVPDLGPHHSNGALTRVSARSYYWTGSVTYKDMSYAVDLN